MRRIFVGDIQGCRAELDHLLEEVNFVEGVDVLHPVGDLVRKGPDSPGVLSRLMDLDAQPVLGNHDLRYLTRNEAVDSAHARWLRAQPIVRVIVPGLKTKFQFTYLKVKHYVKYAYKEFRIPY